MTKAVLTEAEVRDYRNQLGDGFLMNSNGVEQLLNAITALRSRNAKLREALEFYAKIHSASEARRLFVMDAGKRARTILELES